MTLGKTASRLLANYYRGPDHPFKLRLINYLMQGLGYPRLTIPYCNTGWITVDLRDVVQTEILTQGSYEPEVWEALSCFATEDEVFWDIGAHIGGVSIKAALDPRIREVHAFEPHPETFALLRMSLDLNDFSNVIAHPLALSDKVDAGTLYDGAVNNLGTTSLLAKPTGRTFQVLCRTVDDLIANEGFSTPSLLKIDVEHWEERVLRGAAELMKKAPPKAIVFESFCECSSQDPVLSVSDFLKNFGYSIRKIPRCTPIQGEFENFIARR